MGLSTTLDFKYLLRYLNDPPDYPNLSQSCWEWGRAREPHDIPFRTTMGPIVPKLWELIYREKPELPLVQTCTNPLCINPRHYRPRLRRVFGELKPKSDETLTQWCMERVEDPSSDHWIWIGPEERLWIYPYAKPLGYQRTSVVKHLWIQKNQATPPHRLFRRCAQPMCVHPDHHQLQPYRPWIEC